MALKRENKRLRNKLDSSKRTINRLNKELSDSEATIEYYNMLLEERFQELKKYKTRYGELE
ncbi:MAG: hypothetical protein IJF83_03155 [Methanobrevibacter sp.]|nr:hypothetical protein [Methanobrevibacter sp.]